MDKNIYDSLKSNNNFNLKKFSENDIKSIISKEGNYIVNNKDDLKRYVIEALSNNDVNKNLHLGIIPKKTIAKIKDKITDIKIDKINSLFNDSTKYALVVNQKEIRHMKKDCLSIYDIINFVCSLDDIIVNFDSVRYTLYNNSQKAFRFKKKINNNIIIALEVISNKNHTIRTHTMFYDMKELKKKHIPNA